jgi:peptide/nickel transport system ATP-binding protein
VEVEKLYTIPGSVPNLIMPPSGCRFHPRCNYAKEFCKQVKPPLTEIREGHFVACHKITGASGYA